MKFETELYSSKKDNYFSYQREEMLSFVPNEAFSILDVGCSSGDFGKLLKDRRGCEVWGIEPTKAAFDANKYLDFVFHETFHSELDFKGKKFDAIIFNDVLEHLTNPWDALELAKKNLKDGGHIIASIPNVQCYIVIRELVLEGDWKYKISGILDKTHYRFFTRKSIFRLFEEIGFEIELIEGQNSVLSQSRLLRILKLFFPKKLEPFLFINYAIRAKIKM